MHSARVTSIILLVIIDADFMLAVQNGGIFSTVSDPTTTVHGGWSSINFEITDTYNESVSVVALGTPLEMHLILTGTIYSSMMPRDCYFSDSINTYQKISFVRNNCPKRMPNDIGSTMQRVTKTLYKLPFNAFSFSPKPLTSLDIVCQLTLCIAQNEDDLCNQNCWMSAAEELREGIPWDADSPEERSLWNRLNDADTITETINLIVTNKNYSVVTGQPNPPGRNPNNNTRGILYVMYGLTALFAVLFAVILSVIIWYAWCSSAATDQSDDQVGVTSHRIDYLQANRRSAAAQLPYTVFHIPRVRPRDCSRTRYDSKSTTGFSSAVEPSLHWSKSLDSSRSTVLSYITDAR